MIELAILVVLGIIFIFAFMLGYQTRRNEEGKLKDLIDTPSDGYYYQKNKEMLNLIWERNKRKGLVK
jgi:hypothetical protein